LEKKVKSNNGMSSDLIKKIYQAEPLGMLGSANAIVVNQIAA